MPHSTYVSDAEFVAYVSSRGYVAEPLSVEDQPSRINGYRLVGPRGNKKIVIKNAEGKLALFDAELWCDGVDYSTSKITAKPLAPVLTERELAILRGAATYGLSDAGGQYYQLGGHGCVPVRFHHATLYSLERRGLVKRVGYWQATESGKALLESSAT